jgi:phospholipase C
MIQKFLHRLASLLTATALLVAAPGSLLAGQDGGKGKDPAADFQTTTPIKHLIVIFQENISFDHYFGTYPQAVANDDGTSYFKQAKDDTPRVNNLLAGGLLDQNPNSTQPFRLDHSQALTCDQGHGYTQELTAVNHGLMDNFPAGTGNGGPGCPEYGHGTGIVMGYYDGNTVTAMWNYAQHYAMSDNFYGTMFGPSTVGALNLAVGTTDNATLVNGTAGGTIANGASSGAVIGDPDPGYDDCSPATKTHVTVTGVNIGDQLNAKQVTWGWFQGGFIPTSGTAPALVCGNSTTTSLLGKVTDYVPHHEPFQYFSDTSNPQHLPPSDASKIGQTDQANHQYDLSSFWTALGEDRLPAVSFLKAKAFQNGHPGNSDPLDEQTWLVTVVNAVENSKAWKDTAIMITYDDSDGWYDHQMDPIVNQSDASDDTTTTPLGTLPSCGTTPSGGVAGRCGYGPRLPLVVISPYAKANYVDHRATDQSSIIRFIEDNWQVDRIGGDSNDSKAGTLSGFFDFDDPAHPQALILDPSTGVVLSH